MEASQIVAMPRLPTLGRWTRYALILFAIWSVPGILLATSVYVAGALKHDPISIGDALLWRMPEWQVWAIATPGIVWLGRRFPLSRWWSAPIHLVAATLVGAGDIVVYALSARLVGMEPMASTPLLDIVPWMLLKTAFFELLLYGTVIGTDHVIAVRRRYRESVLKQTQLEARLASTQLEALKAQLRPHFLFNTINSINVLMRKGDSASAIRMLSGMSDLLRRSLTTMKVELVTLHEELDFVERYLDIERTRFPDRLRVVYDVADDTRQALVPSMILQPLVENAIEHGIAPRASGGRITVAARALGERLVIEIRDDGIGLSPAGSSKVIPKGHGVGLSHVRKRLAQLYPDRHRFALEAAVPTGAIATLEIPFELAQEEAA